MINMNNDMLTTIIGGAIGLVSALSGVYFQRFLDRRGELNIFYKFCYRKERSVSWGFETGVNNINLFTVPIVFEFQNTTNVTKVVRDVSLLLYKGDSFVCKMDQMDHLHITSKKGNTITNEEDLYYGAEKGSYSFVIGPRSLVHHECEFMYKAQDSELKNLKFDTLKLRYYDEKNKEYLFLIRKINDCWNKKLYPYDKEWILIK